MNEQTIQDLQSSLAGEFSARCIDEFGCGRARATIRQLAGQVAAGVVEAEAAQAIAAEQGGQCDFFRCFGKAAIVQADAIKSQEA